MKGKKGSTDEGGVRSPLHLRWPQKVKKGQILEQVTGAIDLLPSLASMAGVNFQEHKKLDGLDFSSLITDEECKWDDNRSVLAYWKGKASLRSGLYRLDRNHGLYDMSCDHTQSNDLSELKPQIKQEMQKTLNAYLEEANHLSDVKDSRPFVICHEDFKWTQIPARDGHTKGGIKRSNRWPNCSFFTNWKSLDDAITFDVNVLSEGSYEVDIYYTCPVGSEGSKFRINFGNSSIDGEITEAHDPPLFGMDDDRSKRMESYVKDFKRLTLGKNFLEKGAQKIVIEALNIAKDEVMDFRLMMLKKLD